MAETDLKKWQTNSSKYLVNDRWLKLRSDSCATPEGRTIEPFYVLEYPDWVNCLVIDSNANVVMVKHYRHGAGQYVAELVSGAVETTDKSPSAGMQRELAEEIGYVGGDIYQTGVSYPNSASQTNKVYSFIAFGGSCTQKQQLENGEDLYVMKVPSQDFVETLLDSDPNIIYQSMHLATIFFGLTFMRQSTDPRLEKLRTLINIGHSL